MFLSKTTRTLALVVATAVGATACSTAEDQPAAENSSATVVPTPEPPVYEEYVALGDSYAAMGSRSAATTGPAACVRSEDNYPNGVADHPRVNELIDVTCSSAVTADLLNPRSAAEDVIPPQLESLSETTDLVTLSIGGNDIGFPAIAQCFQRTLSAQGQTDCAGQFAEIDLTAELPDELNRIHEEIQARAPHARVVVTGYLPLVSADGQCPGADFISAADRAWAAELTGEVNAVVREAATSHGAEFVLPSDASAHTACAAPEDRWADLIGAETNAYPMHPTPAGQDAMAEAVKEVL